MTINHDTVQEYSVLALEHFLKHREIVIRKLKHAEIATRKSLQAGPKKARPSPADRAQASLYSRLWKEIIADFEKSGITEDDLNVVEKILVSLPKAIKKLYDFLVQQDSKLQALIKELQTESYKRALDFMRKRQAKPDPLSGMAPESFNTGHKSPIREKATLYFPHTLVQV